MEPTSTDRSRPAFHAHEDINGVLWVHPYGGGFSYFGRPPRVRRARFRLLTKCGVQGDHPPAGVWGRAPKPYAAAFFVSVASVRRTQETRLSPNSGVFQRSEPPEGAWHLGKVMVSEGTAPILHSFASKTDYRPTETPRCHQPGSADTRLFPTG